MTDLRTRFLAVRELGLSALLPYAAYRIRLSTGALARRTPVQEWADRPFEAWVHGGIPTDSAGYAAYRAKTAGPRFFFDASPGGVPRAVPGPPPESLLAEAEAILGGRFRLFGGDEVALGWPPDWFAFPPPLSHLPRADSTSHWTKVALDAPGVDARLVWETSRFGWVFPLARAYRWTGEAKYAEACRSLIDDWRRANRPHRGIHWTSGQEVALRLLALAFAERAFFPDWSRRPGWLQGLAQLVGFHAARLPATLDYARAQNNNHLLSEAAGLVTAGILFPELQGSEHWRALGRRLLVDGFGRQVFDDGGYIQHSANYQRLALALGVWTARLAELSGEPFQAATLGAVERLARSLAIQADGAEGRTSNFGPDDGSDILRLSSTSAHDVRPYVAAAARLALGETWYPAGPWDETSGWLGLVAGARTEAPHSESLPDTGLHYLQGREVRGALRCVEFHERPGHSDQLHVDLWLRGQLCAFDPGSYLYNGPGPWDRGLADAVFHNTPVVDGEEPMRRAGRFLWADRAQGRLMARWRGEHFEAVRAAHDGYRRLGVRLERTLALVDGRAWIVLDRIVGTGRRRLTVGWNFPDVPWSLTQDELRLSLEGGELVVGWDGDGARAGLARRGVWAGGQAAEGPIATWGWSSPTYSVIEPCLRLVLDVAGDCPLMLRTRISAEGEWPAPMAPLWDDPTRLEPPNPGSGAR